MPSCRWASHSHPAWPRAGPLVICGAEQTCGYCTGAAAEKRYALAPKLRQHVRDHHTDGGLMDYSGVEVKMCLYVVDVKL